MTLSSENQANEQNTVQQTATRQVAGLAAIFVLMAVNVIRLASGEFTWQAGVLIVTAVLRVLLVLFSLSQIRRGRLHYGLQFAIGTIAVTFLIPAVLVQGIIGLLLAAIIFLSTILLASGYPEGQQRRQMLAVGVLFTLLTILAASIPLNFRVEAPIQMELLAGIIGVLSLILVYFVAQGYGNYSLNARMITGFLFVALVGGALSFYSYTLLTASINEQVLPTEQLFADIAWRSRTVQAEALEFLSGGEEKTLDELAESATTLTQLSDELTTLAVTPEDVEQYRLLAANAASMSEAALELVAAHEETLEALEALEEAEDELEALLVEARSVINDEIARNLEAGDLEELEEDALPALAFLAQFATSAQVVRGEAAEFVATGEEDTAAEFAEALARQQTASIGLRNTFEADEPGEAALLSQFEAVELSLETAAQTVITAHTQVLDLVEGFEEVEENLDSSLTTTEQLIEANVNNIFTTVTNRYLLIGALTLLISLGLSLVLSRGITGPIARLVAATQKLAAGDLTVQAAIESRDEVGRLGLAFNSMASRIQQTLGELQASSLAISTSADISRQLSTILDPTLLTSAVVEQLKAAFGYYHAHIYLLDDAGEYLVLAGGTGEVGQALLSQNHRIAMGKGLVGQTAVRGRTTLVPDVTQDLSWLPNPLLPDTQAELAVPIALGGRVLGVLDVQNDVVNSLGEADVELLETIAGQVAIGLQNANLFNERLEAGDELLKYKLALEYAPDAIFMTDVDGRIIFANAGFEKLYGYTAEEAVGKTPRILKSDAVSQEQYVDFWQKLLAKEAVSWEIVNKTKDGRLIEVDAVNSPIVGQDGSLLGFWGQHQSAEGRKQNEAILARRASELEIVSKVGVYAATILETRQLLQEAVDLAKEEFGLYHAHIYMLNPSGDKLNLFVGAGEVGRHMASVKRAIPVDREQSLVAQAARMRQGIIENNVQENPAFLPNPLLPDTRAEMAVPMLVGDTLLGVLDVQADQEGYFSQESLNVYATLTSQLGVAVQNARSFEQMKEAVDNMNQLTRQLTRDGWQDYLANKPEVFTYRYQAADETAQKPQTAVATQPKPKLAHTLQIQGQPIGQLQLEAPTTYAEDANEIITAVAERLSAHLENLRLTETSEIARANAEKRNEELGLINRMMSSVTSSLNLTGNLEIIAKELADAIDVSHVGIALITDDKQSLQVVTEFPEPADDVIGTLIPIAGNPLTEKAIQSRKFQIAYDAQNNVLTEPIHELMRHRGVHALAVVPMILGDEFFGTIGFDLTDSKRRMSEEQISLAETIVYQAATVVQNARLFSQTQEALAATNKQARRLALLNELSETISRQLSPDEIVATVIDKVTDILDVKRVSMHLIDEKDHTMLRVAGVTGEAADVAHGELIPIEGSPMGDALTTHQIAQGYFSVDDVRFPAIFVPLFVGNQDFGTFNLVLLEHDAELQESDRQIILQLSAVLAAALENQRLFNQTRKRAERERLLNEIVTQVAASLDLQHSLQIIVDEMATALNVDQVRVALIQPDGKELLIIAEHYDPHAPSAIGLTIPLEGNVLTQNVIDTRKMVVVEDAQNNALTVPVHDLFREQGIQTVVLLPLVVNDEVLGTIGLDILDERVFDVDTLQLAETIVYQAAVAIQNARLFEKSQAALAETETLYAYTSQLNTATNLDAVLDSAAAPGFQVGATDALLLVYDQDTSGNMGTGRFLASSPRHIVPLGETLLLREQPFSRFWPSSGKNILFLGDIGEDQRLNAKEQQAFSEMGIHALAIMFLSVGNLRIGQIIIRWQNKQTFTAVDERLYGAIAQQASSVVYNRLLFNQTEEALSETAALYQASVDLNSAGAYEQILNALRQHTILGQGSTDVSLNFFNRPWVGSDMPETVDVLARWSTLQNELPNRYKLTAFPEAEKVLQPDNWLICSDVATDERMSERTRSIFMNRFKAKSLLYVPLVVGGQWIGFISGTYSQTRDFPEAQIRRLNVLARQAAVSIRSLQLLAQTRRRADREALINSINQKIQSAPTVEFALQTAVTELSQALNLKKAAIELVSEQTQITNGRLNGKMEAKYHEQ